MDVADNVVCVSVLDTLASPAKTDEPIEMQFGGQTSVSPRNHVLHGDVHWCRLMNTIKRTVPIGGHVDCGYLTVATCSDL